MTGSDKSLQVIYHLCLFYIGNLLTSLFLRNFVGELAFIVGIAIILVTLYRLSRIEGYGLKGGCICFAIAFVLNLIKIPENMALYLMMERSSEAYVHDVSEFIIGLRKWQVAERIIIGSSLVLKLAGWILWMRKQVFREVKKMFYFFFADIFSGMIVLAVWSVEHDVRFMIYLSLINVISFIVHAMALIVLGVFVYRLGKNTAVLQKSRKCYASILCFVTGSCYLPFLFVGYVTYQLFLFIGCVLLLYGIKIWGVKNRCLNVYYGWLCVGGLVMGITGYRIYCTFALISPSFFYWVFVIWGMITAGYGLMSKGNGGNKRVFAGLGILSLVLIPLTLLYSRGIAFFTVAVVWAWIWLPLWILCLDALLKNYFQTVKLENSGFAGSGEELETNFF